LFGSTAIHAQVLPTFGNSRTGGSGMQFLKIAPDARSMAMGGAGVSVVNDLSASYWNPAGITSMDTGKANVMMSSALYIGDVKQHFVGAGLKLGQLSFVSFHVVSMDYGVMKETTEFEPNGTGRTFKVANYELGLSYARILTNNFSFGMTGKFASEGLPGVSINNVLFDLGLRYNVGIKNARFGITFSNFGFNINPSGDVTLLKFTGDQNVSTFSSVSVPAMFRLGAAFDPVSMGDHQVTVSGQLNHPTDNNETYNLGAEYRYLGILAFRTGYEFKSDATYAFPSVGCGIKLSRRVGGISIDYGYLNREYLGGIHRLSLSILIK